MVVSVILFDVPSQPPECSGQQISGQGLNNLFPYDVVVLLVIDCILYIKLIMFFNLEVLHLPVF
jgi:hypothetical protein